MHSEKNLDSRCDVRYQNDEQGCIQNGWINKSIKNTIEKKRKNQAPTGGIIGIGR
jgi:hypothetical protein